MQFMDDNTLQQNIEKTKEKIGYGYIIDENMDEHGYYKYDGILV